MTIQEKLQTSDPTRIETRLFGQDFQVFERAAVGQGPKRFVGMLSEILPVGTRLRDREGGTGTIEGTSRRLTLVVDGQTADFFDTEGSTRRLLMDYADVTICE